MASATSIPLHGFCSHFSFSCLSAREQTHKFLGFSPLNSHVFTALLKKRRKYRIFIPPRDSLEGDGGVPNDLAEDAKFVPLNADDPVFGPPALLLLGFEVDETNEVQKLLRELDGEFLKIIHCTEQMVNRTVWDAVHTEQPSLEAVKIAKSVPRICFLSGLSGEEIMMFINAFPETGLKPVIFAAVVPNSANKLLGEVMEEVVGDHEMLSAKKLS